MRRVRGLLVRLAAMFTKTRGERELSDEMESLIQMAVDDGIRAGLTPEEARRKAMLDIGGIESVKESYRDQRGIPAIDTAIQDIRYAFRLMRKYPAFTITVVLTLALGIGATTAIFTVVNGVLLRPLPYPNPEQLFYVQQRLPNTGVNPFTGPRVYDAWRKDAHTVGEIAAYGWSQANLSGSGEALRVNCQHATPSLFHILGASPLIGRTFTAQEAGSRGANVVVLSEGLWTRHFGRDTGVLGRPITLSGDAYTIVGVLPSSFLIPDKWGGVETDVWVPIVPGDRRSIAPGALRVIARLKQGTALDAVQAELERLQQPLMRRPRKAQVVLDRWQDEIASKARTPLLIFLTATGLVLLIACVNVAGLMLARSTARQQEISVRRAIGASNARIMRQLMMESVVLSVIGSVGALAFAAATQNLLLMFLGRSLPDVHPIGMDYRVFAFNAVLGVLVGLAAGLAPALNTSMKESARNSTPQAATQRARTVLAAVEIAIAVIVLSGAVLLTRSFLKLQALPPGFESANVLTMEVSLTPSDYAKADEQARFFEVSLERIAALPGARSAAATTGLPFGSSTYSAGNITLDGRPEPIAHATYSVVSPAYFRTLGIRLLQGREFGTSDRPGSPPVAIVDDAFRERYCPQQQCAGRMLRSVLTETDSMTIVGVAATVGQPMGREPLPHIYFALGQQPSPQMVFAIRVHGDPMQMAAAAKSQIASVDASRHSGSSRWIRCGRCG